MVGVRTLFGMCGGKKCFRNLNETYTRCTNIFRQRREIVRLDSNSLICLWALLDWHAVGRSDCGAPSATASARCGLQPVLSWVVVDGVL